MNHRRTSRVSWLLVGCLLAWLAGVGGGVAVAAPAAPDFPPAADAVNDVAGLLNPDEMEKLKAATRAAAAEHGIEVVVVVIHSVGAYDPSGRIEPFATALFNRRGIGDPKRNDGVLVLLAVADREVRIELGSGYDPAYDPAVLTFIDRFLVPRFRVGDWAGGLLAAVEGIGPVITAPPPAPRRPPERKPPKRRRPRSVSDTTFEFLGWTGGLALASVCLAFVGRAILRRRPRSCPRCGARMSRLSELDEDDYLDWGQQAEETVGSVQYDVWRCTKCSELETKAYGSWIRHRDRCPECSYRTISENRMTTLRPTTSSSGVREITQSCVSCDYEVSWEEVIPMLRQHDHSGSGWSSGGSSFSGGGGGGGSSSGGGATGSW